MNGRWLLCLALCCLAISCTGCDGGTGPDYEAARWVLDQEGQVTVVDADGTQRLVTPNDSLPGGAITIRKIAWDLYPGDRNERIADADLSRFAALDELTELDLWASPITDAGAADLAALRSLKRLNLSETQITDAALLHVAKLAGLERLYLTNTQVSDAGLQHLVGLKQLKHVDLVGTQTTKAGAERLRRAIPGCVVLR